LGGQGSKEPVTIPDGNLSVGACSLEGRGDVLVSSSSSSIEVSSGSGLSCSGSHL
jgi:hypothetical protein